MIYLLLLFVFFLINSYISVLNESNLKPYAFNFAIMRSWGRSSNALGKSVKRAAKVLPLIVAFFQFLRLRN